MSKKEKNVNPEVDSNIDESIESGKYMGFKPSAEQIDKWKKEHKEIHAVEVEDTNGDMLRVVLKRPTREIMSAAMKFGTSNPMKFNETLYDSCKIAGDIEKIQGDDYLFMTACSLFSNVVEMRKGELKKL